MFRFTPQQRARTLSKTNTIGNRIYIQEGFLLDADFNTYDWAVVAYKVFKRNVAYNITPTKLVV
jgi:hypothetical protein